MPTQPIEFNSQQVKSTNDLLKGIKNGAPTAIRRSVNKTASKAKTEASQEIRKVVTLKAATVNAAIRLTKASFKSLSAKMTISGKPIPLIAFGARQTKKGVSVRVRKANPIEKHKTSFIATMKSGHRGVYKRKGKARLPITEKIGPSIPAVFQFNKESLVSFHAANNLQTILDSEIKFLLSKQK